MPKIPKLSDTQTVSHGTGCVAALKIVSLHINEVVLIMLMVIGHVEAVIAIDLMQKGIGFHFGSFQFNPDSTVMHLRIQGYHAKQYKEYLVTKKCIHH